MTLQHEPCWELPYRLTPTVGPFTPVILDSPQALWLEGKRMHHCVAHYTEPCASGSLLIVSLRDAAQARPVATVSFDLSGREVRLMQVAGFANHLAPPMARWAAQSFLEQLQAQKRALDQARAAVPGQVREDTQPTGAPDTPDITVCTLTRSESYVEVLSLRPVPALPEQYEWRVQSQWLGARDRHQWQRRHQVLVDREALVELRAALDGVLGGDEKGTLSPRRRSRN